MNTITATVNDLLWSHDPLDLQVVSWDHERAEYATVAMGITQAMAQDPSLTALKALTRSMTQSFSAVYDRDAFDSKSLRRLAAMIEILVRDVDVLTAFGDKLVIVE